MSFCSERWLTVRSTNTFSFLSFYIIFFLLRVSKGPILFRVRRMLVWGLSKKKNTYFTYIIHTQYIHFTLRRHWNAFTWLVIIHREGMVFRFIIRACACECVIIIRLTIYSCTSLYCWFISNRKNILGNKVHAVTKMSKDVIV